MSAKEVVHLVEARRDAFDLGGLLQFVLAVLFAAVLIAAFAGGSRRAYA